jgi:hypothetical protein
VKHRAIKRRNVVIGLGAAAGVAAVGGISLNADASTDSSTGSGDGGLVFDPDAYTKLTTTVTDTEGTEHAVTYHFWKAITYVSKPVDATYQSLNVSVPVEIDGTAVDASNAPILFANSVGGYMPSSVANATGIGAGGMGGGGMGGGTPSGAPSASTSTGPSAGTTAPGANGNTNLAARAENLGDEVNHLYYWDQGHGANTDPGDFITWIAEVTGYKKSKKSKQTR